MKNNTLMNRLGNKELLFFFVAVGLLFRIYAFAFTPIINQDGVFYIEQAEALLNRDLSRALICGYNFISLYHVLIPVFHKIFGDWLIAAKMISLLFGTATIIPFYFILKHFFRASTVYIGTLAFSINPYFVARSVDIIKDPIFWFFSLLGMLFFIKAIHSDKKDRLFLFSSISYLIAGVARIESFVFLAGTALYLCFTDKGRRAQKLFMFGLPVLAVMILFLVLAVSHSSLHIWKFYLQPRIHLFFSGVTFELIGTDLIHKSLDFLIIIFKKSSKLNYEFFFPILIAGFLTIRKEVKRMPQFSFFVFLFVLSLMSLYFFYLKIGVMSSRYAALIMLPAYVFIGSGIENIIAVTRRKNVREKTIIIMLCLYIIVTATPHNLKHKREDKIVLKNIGQYISEKENNRPVTLMAHDPRIMFYTNLDTLGRECAHTFLGYDHLLTLPYRDLPSWLKEKNVQYFIWDDRSWRHAPYDFLTNVQAEHFAEINQWDTDERTFIAFEVLYE